MNLFLDFDLAKNYKSPSQKIRIASEFWLKNNGYCPFCGNLLNSFANNMPVADFYCQDCKNQFELKSKAEKIGRKIADGAYETMISRINGNENPNLFILTYQKSNGLINDLILIPKFFFTFKIIEKRKALSLSAKRAGWVGCNILFSKIPNQAKIFLIKNNHLVDKQKVLAKSRQNLNLNIEKSSRTWLIDILNCIEALNKINFTLDEIYEFENLLSTKHGQNKFIKAKIRQQLQFLRDKGIIEFLGNGKYKRIII